MSDPITPGEITPDAAAPAQSVQPPKGSRKRLYIIAACAVVVLAGAGVGIFAAVSAANASAQERAEQVALRDEGLDFFKSAIRTCSVNDSYALIADGGTTLTLDSKGKGFYSPGITYTSLTCVIGQLDTPSRITSVMDSTRALDGRQQDQWDTDWGTVAVSWTYHPDDGLDVVYSSKLTPELAALEDE